MKILHTPGWIYYYSENQTNQNPEKTGKWMFDINDINEASKLCSMAVESGIVQTAKHGSPFGLKALFYADYDDLEAHKKIITFFLEHDLIPRTRNGRLFNISFKLDSQTRQGQYGENYHPFLTLDHFLDLDTGKWQEPLLPIPEPPRYTSRVIKKIVLETCPLINGAGMKYEPKEGEEFKQRLTISSKGKVYFHSYAIRSESWRREALRKEYRSISVNSASAILNQFSSILEGAPPKYDTKIVGYWRLDVTFDDDGVKTVFASLSGESPIADVNLSEYIRDRVPINDMMLFDRLAGIEERIQENLLRVKRKQERDLFCQCKSVGEVAVVEGENGYWDVCCTCRRPLLNGFHEYNHYDGEDHIEDIQTHLNV